MHSRLVPISSSFSSFDLSIASVTRESTIPCLGEVNGGSDSKRDRHSAVRSTGKVGHGNCSLTPSGAIPCLDEKTMRDTERCLRSFLLWGRKPDIGTRFHKECSTSTQSRGAGIQSVVCGLFCSGVGNLISKLDSQRMQHKHAKSGGAGGWGARRVCADIK